MKTNIAIGIAGYMGSGKSTLARYWSERFDAFYIDVDKLARSMMIEDDSVVQNVGRLFSVVENGAIDFQKLGAIVFADKTELERLNQCVHPPLIELLNSTVKNQLINRHVIVDAALLPLWVDNVKPNWNIWIESGLTVRAERLVERMDLPLDSVIERIKGQMELFSKPAGSNWYTVENNSSLLYAKDAGEKYIESLLKDL